MNGPVLEPPICGMCALCNLRATENSDDEPVRISGVTKRGIFYNRSLVLPMIVPLCVRKCLGLRL